MKVALNALGRMAPRAPLCFLGMGFFRAWIECSYLNPIVTSPASVPNALIAFDLTTAVILALLALVSGRIAPLFDRRWARPVCAFLLVASTCISFGAATLGAGTPLMGMFALLAGSAGTALALMLWSELYACISPLQIALYFSASVMCGCALAWFLRGMALPQAWMLMCLLPVLAVASLRGAYATLPKSELPRATVDRFSFPWKPVMIVALFCFAMSFAVRFAGGTASIDSNLGAFLGAAAVFFGVATRRGDFDFTLLWKVGIPSTLAAFALVCLLVPGAGLISSIAATVGGTLFLILMMVILGNMSYRYGMCALWLFAIERAVRMVFGRAGAVAGTALASQPLPPGELVLIMTLASVGLAAVTALTFSSEASLSSMWGMVLREGASLGEADRRRSRVGIKCRSLSAAHDLTDREEEILFHLAQGRRPARIADELGIGLSTVRTHVKHIYQKLDIHSSKELIALVGLPERKEVDPDIPGTRDATA